MIYVCADTHSRKIEFDATEEDTFIHCGDWEQGEVITKAKKVLVRGNHDIFPPEGWDLVVDGLLIDKYWFTHEPAERLPKGAIYNICGHVHYHNMNDIGYEKKWFHRVLPPNTILTLDKFLFEYDQQNKQEKIWE